MKSKAAERSQSLKAFVTEALQEKLAGAARVSGDGKPPWMSGSGQLSRLSKETRRINARIENAFEEIEPEDRA